MGGLFAHAQHGRDFGPGRTLFAADFHHLGDALGYGCFQGVELTENVQFPEPATEGSVLCGVQLEPPNRFGR
jgi:hypothetical protein